MLYDTFIFPIQTLMEFILKNAHQFTQSWGLSICILSVIISILISPLQKVADFFKNREDLLQDSMKDELDLIKRRFTGIKRHAFIQNVYRRYNYSPIYSLRASLGLLILIPFFYSAYDLLVKFSPLSNSNFLFINNLAKPDKIIFGINLLPILMLIFSILNAVITARFANKKHNSAKSLLVLNIAFFVLLYNAPVGAVLYWTTNNIVSITKQLLSRLFFPSCLTSKENKDNYLLAFSKPIFAFIKNIFERPFTLLMIIMFWSLYKSYYLNWFIISFSDLLKTFAWLTALASVGILFITLVFWGIKMLISKNRKLGFFKSLKSSCVQACFFAALMSFFVLNYKLIYSIIPFPSFFNLTAIKRIAVVFIAGAFISLVLLLITKNKRAKFTFILSTFFATIVLLNTFNLFAQIGSAKDFLNFDQKTAVNLDNIKFKTKPNVYFFVLESYQSPDVLQNSYNIDPKPFCDFLKSKDFIISKNTWANYTATLPSLQGIYTLKQHEYQTQIGEDNVASRGILTGQINNNVYKVFFQNGYEINRFWPDSFTYRYPADIKSIYPGALFYAYDARGQFHAPRIFPETIMLHTYVSKFMHKFIPEKSIILTLKGHLNQIESFINAIPNQAKPQFTTIKLIGLGHADNFIAYKSKTGKANLDNFAAKGYPESIKPFTKAIEQLISTIRKNDPSAIILITGDHGTHRYRGLHESFFDNDSDTIKKYSQINNRILIDDLSKVFYATCYPKNFKHPAPPKTNIQMFPQLFRVLSGNKNLDFKIPNNVYFEGLNKKIYKIKKIDSKKPIVETLK